MRADDGGDAGADTGAAGGAGGDLEPVSKPALVFDMDGVLVDVSESYRETIAQTVEHFTGAVVAREKIQELKNQGGWNDDWKLSHHMVTTAGVDVPFESVKEHFQKLFLGGLMQRERWV